MERIENLSDQIIGYSEEIANAVDNLCVKNKYSREEAIQCVKIATNNMMLDVFHHIEADIQRMVDLWELSQQ